MELLQVAITSVVSFLVLFFLAKIMGHRQIAQLSVFDYINGITIGSIAAELATELEKPLRPLLALVIYALLTVLLFRIVPMPLEVFRPINGATVEPFSISAVASVALLSACAMLLLTTRHAGKKALDSDGDLC